jgi:hypothetical protein
MKGKEKKRKKRMERKKPEIDDFSSFGASFTNELKRISFPTIFLFSQMFSNAANPHSLIFESPFSHHKIEEKQRNKKEMKQKER